MQASKSEETGKQVEEDSSSGTVTGLPWWNGRCSQPLEENELVPEVPMYVQASGDPRTVDLAGQQGLNCQVEGMEQDQTESSLATGDPSTKLPTVPAPCGFTEAGMGDHHQPGFPTYIPPPGEYVPPHVQLDPGNPLIPTLYPYSDLYFGGILAAYGAQAMIHPHILGLQQARMPLPSELVEEEPVYVNAKQYHGILRRRQLRAKAESENKLVKTRKPYLHESRHQHALRRARGCGGRFLNCKEKEGPPKDSTGNLQLFELSSSEPGSGKEANSAHPGQGKLPSTLSVQDGERITKVLKSATQNVEKFSHFMVPLNGTQDRPHSTMSYYGQPEGHSGGQSAEAGKLSSGNS